MTIQEVARIRLANHQVIAAKERSPEELVGRMIALQAQDYSMALWAVGARVPGNTENDIVRVMNSGGILRTHLLRPTWHLVSAENIYWLLDLTAPQIRASMKSRNRELGLTASLVSRSNRIIASSLEQGENLTREEIMARLDKEKIFTGNNRLSHLLMEAELEGIACSGVTTGKKKTYALLEKRVKKAKRISKDEALRQLAFGYFSTRFPATLQDFTWWSGLPVTIARKAVEMIRDHFISEMVGSDSFLVPDSFEMPGRQKTPACLLPAYDEFILSYRTRNVVIPGELQSKAVSDNGIFRPVILLDGQAAGVWKRTIIKEKVILEAELFRAISKAERKLMETAADSYGRFLEKKAELKI